MRGAITLGASALLAVSLALGPGVAQAQSQLPNVQCNPPPPPAGQTHFAQYGSLCLSDLDCCLGSCVAPDCSGQPPGTLCGEGSCCGNYGDPWVISPSDCCSQVGLGEFLDGDAGALRFWDGGNSNLCGCAPGINYMNGDFSFCNRNSDCCSGNCYHYVMNGTKYAHCLPSGDGGPCFDTFGCANGLQCNDCSNTCGPVVARPTYANCSQHPDECTCCQDQDCPQASCQDGGWLDAGPPFNIYYQMINPVTFQCINSVCEPFECDPLEPPGQVCSVNTDGTFTGFNDCVHSFFPPRIIDAGVDGGVDAGNPYDNCTPPGGYCNPFAESCCNGSAQQGPIPETCEGNPTTCQQCNAPGAHGCTGTGTDSTNCCNNLTCAAELNDAGTGELYTFCTITPLLECCLTQDQCGPGRECLPGWTVHGGGLNSISAGCLSSFPVTTRFYCCALGGEHLTTPRALDDSGVNFDFSECCSGNGQAQIYEPHFPNIYICDGLKAGDPCDWTRTPAEGNLTQCFSKKACLPPDAGPGYFPAPNYLGTCP